MIRHIVILHFIENNEIDYFQLLKDTKPFILQIPGIIKFEIYKNESKYTPKNISSFGIEINFKDQNALEVFMNHPKHYEANATFEKYLANPPYMVLTHHYTPS